MPTAATTIDARTLGPEPSGIGVYTLNLLRGIDAAGPDRPVTAWIRPEVMDALPAAVQRSSALRLVPKPGRVGWGGARQRPGERDAVLHCPDVFAPLRGRWRRVVTLHDVIPLVCRGQLARSRKQRLLWFWERWLRLQTRRAAAVLTVSDYSARDIVRTLEVRREKITVIHNAVAPPAGLAEGMPAAARDAGRFILNVGRRDPYKNVPGLVRAFAQMRAGCPDLGDVRLLVVGPRDRRYPEAEDLSRRLGIDRQVMFCGYVEHEALAAMYRAAALVAVPSRYEGFGLPLAEAMRAGTPVVCSNASCLPEVAGGAALLVAPDDSVGFADAMARVLRRPRLAAGLARRGLRRSGCFSLVAFGAAHLRRYAELTRA